MLPAWDYKWCFCRLCGAEKETVDQLCPLSVNTFRRLLWHHIMWCERNSWTCLPQLLLEELSVGKPKLGLFRDRKVGEIEYLRCCCEEVTPRNQNCSRSFSNLCSQQMLWVGIWRGIWEWGDEFLNKYCYNLRSTIP